jgi:hypothetical protein
VRVHTRRGALAGSTPPANEFIFQVHEQLEQAQNHYKLQYDRNHQELEFNPGDWVWLRLLHRPVASLNVIGRGKLGLKYYDPFRVRERIGEVAYKLQLPPDAKLHGTFHLGLLMKFHSETSSSPGCCHLFVMGALAWSQPR